MAIENAVQTHLSVADPLASYNSMKQIWDKNRAVCSGERFVKSYDGVLDVQSFRNLLIPFSPSMTAQQFSFYKAEAEFPGITSQYAKMLVGGLLRKQPTLTLPEDAPEGARQWIMDAFGQDNSPLVSFLDEALWEEIQTSRAWVFLDYPNISADKLKVMDAKDMKDFKPYPVLVKAESVINWKESTNDKGVKQLTQIIIRGYEESFTKNEFHSDLISTVWVHEIVNGYYQIRKFQKSAPEGSVPVIAGKQQKDFNVHAERFELVSTNASIFINNQRMTIIPAWPLNGSIEISESILTPLVDREIGLYNKLSRRNHLLYGASSYTPVLESDMTDEEFEEIVDAGLGSWIKIKQGDKVYVLDTPTAALKDMQEAIASTIEEMAKMGIRMLTPESAQSGIALEIRNAAQTAQLGTLNIKVSNQLADIIAFMLNWRYDKQYTSTDVQFSLSADFNPTPLGADWLRLATEWYQSGIIPRSIWLEILKINDMVPPDYDDEEGLKEINSDELVTSQADQMALQAAEMKLNQQDI
jgi:hypothetical protein